MIIQIAGTSGSGKSHLMNSFLDLVENEYHATLNEYFEEGRKAPIGYNIVIRKCAYPIYVIGSYNTPTGGCDTIRDVVQLFDMVRTKHKEGNLVLFEGLFVMNHTRGPQLAEEVRGDMCILQLTTPFATCVASINDRREARGEGRLLKKENTRGNYVRAQNYCSKMAAAGARVVRVTREQALPKLLELLEEA